MCITHTATQPKHCERAAPDAWCGDITTSFAAAFTTLLQGFVKQAAPQVWGAARTCFHGGAKIGIAAYIKRLMHYVAVQEEDLMVALVLLDRVLCHGTVALNESTFHRLFLVSLTTACKSRQDYLQPNTYYAAAGGVTLEQFNVLERAYLQCLDFDVHVDKEMLEQYCAVIATMQPKRRLRVSCGGGYHCF